MLVTVGGRRISTKAYVTFADCIYTDAGGGRERENINVGWFDCCLANLASELQRYSSTKRHKAASPKRSSER